MDKIIKEQIKAFLQDKEFFEEDNIIFFIEWKGNFTETKRSGIAFKFNNCGFLIDVYTWDD